MVGIWDLNGQQIINASNIGQASNDWHIAGTGDFNGDGKSDILWRNDNGTVGIWDLNDQQIVHAFNLGEVTNDWHLVA